MTEEVDNKEPGRSLARARQEKDLAMDEVAARLHLSAAQIQSLEENDFESLPEATYVKGYIKNYAKLLELDPADLIASYLEKVNPKKNDTIEMVAINQQKLSAANDSKVMYSIFGIVILVIAIVAIWIGTQGNDETVAEKSETNIAINEQNSGELFGPESEVQSEAGLETEVEGDSADESSQVQEEQEPQYPVAPTKPVTAPQIVESMEKKESVAVSNETETTAGSDVNKNEALVQKEQLNEIVLFFEQNSWADVRDANGKKLLYKTIDEGRVVSVKGVAPFSIFLGNAAGVKLSYNGKQVNFDQYKRGLIARFTVGRR